MPLDVKDAMLSAGLNQPVQPPPPGMSNFQAISGVNPSMNYGMPFKSGSTIENSGTITVNTANPGEVRAQDFNEVGGNVAGLYGRNYSPEDTKAFIPEAKDPTEEQTNEFITAYDEGYEVQDDRYGEILDEAGLQRKGEAGTNRAARLAKREDRYQDRQARREAFDEAVSGGMKKNDARKIKREMRRGARASRKDAWKTFKGVRDLRRQQEAYNLEKKYSQ